MLKKCVGFIFPTTHRNYLGSYCTMVLQCKRGNNNGSYCVKTAYNLWIVCNMFTRCGAFLNIFGKTKKSFSFITGSSNEAVSVEKNNGRSVKETYHTLMLAKKYKGTPTLLNGCKNNTMTLRDASILVNVCNNGINHLGMKDDDGKSALYYAGYTNNDVVGNYLIMSRCSWDGCHKTAYYAWFYN